MAFGVMLMTSLEEAREMRYQDYLELKKEFENEIT
jgi:hypothetical protein